MDKPTFDEWAFQQCVIQGDTIDGEKDSAGENRQWRNRRTGEVFVLEVNNREDGK